MATVYIVKHNGCQLANQLLHYAAIYAYALERGYRCYNPAFEAKYAALFPRLARSPLSPAGGEAAAWPGMLRGPLARRAITAAMRAASDLGLFGTTIRARQRDPQMDLPPTAAAASGSSFTEPKSQRIYFNGWNFRNPAGLAEHRAAIIEAFAPREPERSRVEAFARSLPKDRPVIGVHVRHRDYRTFLDGRWFLSIERFRTEMAGLRQALGGPEPLFVIFSDEPRTAEEFAGFDCRISEATALEDLYRMAHCDLIVGPPSTFSTWAAVYGGTCAWHLERTEGDGFDWFQQGHPTVITRDAAVAHIRARRGG
ncbi:MAG: hypothetical protein ACREJO_11040 [Phycisphaerales bacterium]